MPTEIEQIIYSTPISPRKITSEPQNPVPANEGAEIEFLIEAVVLRRGKGQTQKHAVGNTDSFRPILGAAQVE